jgi:hypothetical protein
MNNTTKDHFIKPIVTQTGQKLGCSTNTLLQRIGNIIEDYGKKLQNTNNIDQS